MQISALEVWHVNNEENNSQMCSLESGSADENIETMKAYMCKQRGMHLGSKISREEITKKINQSMIIPGLSEPHVRTLRATIPENENHIFR